MPGIRFASTLTLPASVAVGTGVGTAVGGAIAPKVQQLANTTWAKFPNMPLQAIEAAMLVASGERAPAWGATEALNLGINLERFAALIDLVDEAPPVATLLTMLRRGIIGQGEFDDGAKKGLIEQEWIPRLRALREVLVSPDQLANARQQGFEQFVDLDTEAAQQGVNADRLALMYELSGNPPGPETALAMWRRSIIGRSDFDQMIREGRTKTKYTDEYAALYNPVLSARDFAELHLRGWISAAEMNAGGALTGHTPEQMLYLFQNRGRPATQRQVFLGYRRGGRYIGANLSERETFDRSILNSNIRPEYAGILWAQRFSYPSLFQLNRLVTSGAFTVERGKEILWNIGWEQGDIDAMAAWWESESGGVSTKWLDRARSRLFTVAHNEYMDGTIDGGQARSLLGRLGALAGEQASILALWDAERGIERRELTPTQVLKLYKKTVFTREQAQARLVDLDIDPVDAAALLDGV